MQRFLGSQSRESGVIKLGPISMGDRLRIGADFDSEEDSEDESPTPSPPPQKRQYKRKTAAPAEPVVADEGEYILLMLCQIYAPKQNCYHCDPLQNTSGLLFCIIALDGSRYLIHKFEKSALVDIVL